MIDNRGFEVVVIGGGPAGVTVALRAREPGASVALVERFGQRLQDEGGSDERPA